MKNKIFHLNEENLKAIGFRDDVIAARTKRYYSMDLLLKWIEKSGLLETIVSTPIVDVTRVDLNGSESYKSASVPEEQKWLN